MNGAHFCIDALKCDVVDVVWVPITLTLWNGIHIMYYTADFQVEIFTKKIKLTSWTWYTRAVVLHVCTTSQTITAVTH